MQRLLGRPQYGERCESECQKNILSKRRPLGNVLVEDKDNPALVPFLEKDEWNLVVHGAIPLKRNYDVTWPLPQLTFWFR